MIATRAGVLERVTFFRKFVEHPTEIGSVTPSSAALVEAMADQVPWQHVQSVIELGSGTGTFTRAMADRVRADCRVILVEQDWQMRYDLQQEFPDFVVEERAEELTFMVHQSGLQHVDCVVSGLPFLSFPKALREEIIREVWQVLSPEGVFVLFQYTPFLRPLLAGYFPSIETKYVLKNFPPALVYTCRFGR